MHKMKLLIFIIGFLTMLFPDEMITGGNYKEKFKEYNAYSDNYKVKLKDFVNAKTGDLTFLNKFAKNKTNIPQD